MKKIIYILFCLVICSCSWVNEPDYISEDLDEDMYNSYYDYDTIDVNIGLNELPYIDDNIKIYSDRYYSNSSSIKTENDNAIVYMNGNLYIEIFNYYKIRDIEWIDTDMNKAIELVHTPTMRRYWCGADLNLGSVHLLLIKQTRKVICG